MNNVEKLVDDLKNFDNLRNEKKRELVERLKCPDPYTYENIEKCDIFHCDECKIAWLKGNVSAVIEKFQNFAQKSEDEQSKAIELLDCTDEKEHCTFIDADCYMCKRRWLLKEAK